LPKRRLVRVGGALAEYAGEIEIVAVIQIPRGEPILRGQGVIDAHGVVVAHEPLREVAAEVVRAGNVGGDRHRVPQIADPELDVERDPVACRDEQAFPAVFLKP
jgi:hypothetical protein